MEWRRKGKKTYMFEFKTHTIVKYIFLLSTNERKKENEKYHIVEINKIDIQKY